MDQHKSAKPQDKTKQHPAGTFLPHLAAANPLADEAAASAYQQLRAYFRYEVTSGATATEAMRPLCFATPPSTNGTDNTGARAEGPTTTAWQLLNIQTQSFRSRHTKFLVRLSQVISGLQELLPLSDQQAQSPLDSLIFAEELLALDKIKALGVPQTSPSSTTPQLARIQKTLTSLLAARTAYTKSTLTIFTSEDLLQSFQLTQVFSEADIKVATHLACQQAHHYATKVMQEWVQLIAALRAGELLLAQSYQKELHDVYFANFELSYLSQEDISYLPPVLVIEESQQLLRQANNFLALLSSSSIVKVLGIQLLEELYKPNGQDNAHHLELANLAIIRRNAYVFQGGPEAPEALEQAYKKGLAFPGPVFWHLLLPGSAKDNDPAYRALRAATESRYFPRLEYQSEENHYASQQITLGQNPATTATLLTYEQTVQLTAGLESRVFHCTPADFLALAPSLRTRLALIPAALQHPKVIPLADYLAQSKDSLAGMIPFIWLVDEQDQLQRAALPFSWVQTCRTRLEYWAFLQSLAGIQPGRAQNAKPAALKPPTPLAAAEKEALKATMEAQFAAQRTADLHRAVVRMLYGLLKPGSDLENKLQEMTRPEVSIPKVTPMATAVATPTVESPAPKREAWVESEECTSCRDCIDALPAVFHYNEDKQACVHNPRGGTFAQIVTAAERCPAACIHPGLPQDDTEAALDKWIKRAEKFN